ncbi:MAG: cytochrome P450 [Bacteroidetes bacterium]|nr:cytochrome P450 [Bacteroidota bacterium]
MSNTIKTEIPGISIVESIIDTKEMVKNPVEVFEKYRKKLGPTFSFYFGGTKRTIVTADPDFLQYVLKDNNSNYEKSHIQVKRFVEFQGVGLTNSHGDYWLRQRKLLSMGFTRSRLTEILPLQLLVLNDFMLDFDKAAKLGPVDIREQMVKFTLRSVGKSLFGSQMHEEELEKFAEAIAQIQSFIVKKVVQPYLMPWYIISGQNDHYQKIRREADQIVKNYVEKRRAAGGKESDILQLVLDTPYKDTGEFMSDETIMIEILQLLVAGNETSTTAATWAFYLLAKNPEHISKIRTEIETVFSDNPIEYSGIVKLTYTSAVLDEAMRVNPPFWMIDREAIDDDEFRGMKIPKGTTVVPYIYGVHHNEKVWQKPDKFDPSRFLSEKTAKMHSFAHIPFGGGPRVCIGQNMAKMQILLVLSAIIKKYDFELTPNKDVGLHAMMLLKPDGPIHMTFRKING